MKTLLHVAALVAVFCAGPALAQSSVESDKVVADGVLTQIRTYQSEGMTDRPILLIALHGDSPFNNPSYQYAFARRIVSQAKNTVSVGMLRPGYTDGEDRVSDGARGDTVGTNYDAPRVAQIAAAISQLKAHYGASAVVLAGHSGGSAITAKLIAAYPDLVDHAVIVSCPCDINPWRKNMFESTGYDGFKGDLDVVSPVDVVSSIADDTGISLFVGRNDQTTRVYLSQTYLERLQNAGKNAELHIVEGKHNIFLHDQIIESVRGTLAAINAAH